MLIHILIYSVFVLKTIYCVRQNIKTSVNIGLDFNKGLRLIPLTTKEIALSCLLDIVYYVKSH